jgi:hypothetical protein
MKNRKKSGGLADYRRHIIRQRQPRVAAVSTIGKLNTPSQ